MADPAETVETFADNLQRYIENIEQSAAEIKQLITNLNEYFTGRLHDKFEREFNSEIHDPILPLTEDLRKMNGDLRADIETVRRVESKSINV